ncbi:iron complex outermembrane receptor protein [Mucilaginibacter yixingensis]|uniref:Iron complex outermembrane receptor protein n=1 Tax=Mucilaginibacter yixingensis TaxID=1295612 RepID=A0A2T5J6W6_9SPHI|nr:TonB-dependent receptor [Mucilaginibacter yixingensis]PTQ94806.1 iron complex outermembrane receptor protein [Mucilaginibacter yixingensis]
MKFNFYPSKTSFILLLLAFCFTSLQAQNTNGKIQGTVKTTDGKRAPAVTITLTELKRTAITNENGTYIFQNVKPGSYTLNVTFIGTSGAQKTVTVMAGKVSTKDFTLTESAAQLEEVSISSGKTLNSRPVTFNKSGLSTLDMPQSTGVVSSQVIQDQQIERLGDAVRNVSGVSLTQTRGGVGETFSARGYSIGIGGGAGSIFKNGVLVNTAGFPEASTLESVEILKGSSALLYGNTSGGLIINMVTKKPKFENGGEVSMRIGSYNEYKPTIDVYGPISQNLAYRAIATYENDGSYRDHVKTERFYANPSLLYNLGKSTTILVEGDFLKSNLTPDWGVGSLNNGQAIPTQVSRSQFINTSWAYSHMNQYTGSFTLNHNFSDNWKLNFIGSAQGTDIDSYGSTQPNTVAANGDWNRTLARANTHEGDYTSQANLTGNFKTGGISHQVLFGTDVTKVNNVSYAYTINGLAIGSYAYDKINIINLDQYAQRTDEPNAVAVTRTTAPVYRYGTYAQDLISLTSKFKVLAGLRWTSQHTAQTSVDSLQKGKTIGGTAATRNDAAFSPKVSLIYQPNTTTSIYAGYSNNFAVNSGTDVSTGQGLKPSVIDQYEAGIKNEFFNGKLSANFGIYHIINNNLAVVAPFRADGVTPNTDNTVKTFSGQTTSDGLEVDLNGNLSKNFYFIAGYGYNFARYTKTSGLKGSNIEGEQLVINPRNTANASLFYTFTRSNLKGVKLGASAFYTGSRLAGYNNTVGQTQAYSRLLPVGGFVTVNVSAGYTYKKVSLLAQLSNLTNTMNYLIHDNYSVTPIPPRQFLTTLAYKF